MRRERTAKVLLRKYRKGQCTEQEKALLESWYTQWHTDEQLLEQRELEQVEGEMWAFIQKTNVNSTKRRFPFTWLAAASIMLALSFVGYWYYTSRQLNTMENRLYTHDVNPGTDHALLTLADGTKVDVNSLRVGQSIVQEGVKISKDAIGNLVYETDLQENKGKVAYGVAYNEISTPKGGQLQVLLPDGSKVWLNAASTLKYPLTFSEGERLVELKGEAYFEVAKQERRTGKQKRKVQPFIVRTGYQQVEVLGTHFNINAYENELETKTTLLEGRVRVSMDGGAFAILNPNEQSTGKRLGKNLEIKAVDPAESIAWKEGEFLFDNTDLITIMKQLERWYDVEIVALERFPNYTYNGKMKRTVKLSKVLQILEMTSDLQFKIEVSSTGRQERRVILLN